MGNSLFRKITLPDYAHLPHERIEGSILKALAYFDIFEYPLLKNEIRQFMDQQVSEPALDEALKRLTMDRVIFLFNGFYSLQNNPGLSGHRTQGNRRAEKLIPKALRIGSFLCRFPYVRAVGISGSLSKHYADEKADIDFFIITRQKRLWIARTLMHIFKKFTFLTGRQHYYCMNYYIDESALALEYRNIFTAIEIKTLIPAGGTSFLNQFFAANEWAHEFLPGAAFPTQIDTGRDHSWLKRSIEWLLDKKIGDRLDDYLHGITSRRWKRKMLKGRKNIKGQTMDLVTGKHFAWSNPQSFQEKVLRMYTNRVDSLRSRLPQYFDRIALYRAK